MAHWGMEDVQACFGDTAGLHNRENKGGGGEAGVRAHGGLGERVW